MPIIDVRMPEQENEGTEASLGRWLKQVGEIVHEHEPLVEINTDKVTVEVAAPATGTLTSTGKQPGDIVLAGEVLGAINTSEAAEPAGATVGIEQAGEVAVVPASPVASGLEMDAKNTFSPATRRLLAELQLDPEQIAKTSRGGRLTPLDIAAHLRNAQPAVPTPASPSTGRLVAHTPMRKRIATHMSHSVQTAPHVTTVFEADMYNVFADRQRRKAGSGEAPSVTAYLIRAAVSAIRSAPEVNSKWHETHLEVFDHVNFGVGTALDAGGLVVPVIHNAQNLDLGALSASLKQMIQKAREGKLTTSDMSGGTFTLSNHGVSGSLLAAPIILPDGQAAILGAGKVQKRVIVCETGGRELFRVRPMVYVTLTIDHRVLDGQQANGFMSAFVKALESPSEL